MSMNNTLQTYKVLLIILINLFLVLSCKSQSIVNYDDSIIIIKGDTAKNVNFYKHHDSIKNGIYYYSSIRLLDTNDKKIIIKQFKIFQNNKRNGTSYTYDKFDNIVGMQYYQNDSLYGYQIGFTLNSNRIHDISLFEKGKLKVVFIFKKSKIRKKIYFNNNQLPYRIIFFNGRFKIKGDFMITEKDIHKDYINYRYYKKKR